MEPSHLGLSTVVLWERWGVVLESPIIKFYSVGYSVQYFCEDILCCSFAPSSFLDDFLQFAP